MQTIERARSSSYDVGNQRIDQQAEHATKLLCSAYPNLTFLKGSTAYESVRASYWTKEQVKAQPACIFQPSKAVDVSIALIILQFTGCPFAVKSGGHGKFHGESSISGGITIDLAKINHITLENDNTAVRVGPGNRWFDVYSALEPFGLTVVGGRASCVGVGGFLLGGGISFYSNRCGWGLDNIQAYEVVLADGTIVTASVSSHPELYKALRGGGGNFGIVTSFTLDVYPYKGMWGGPLGWDLTQREAVISGFLDVGSKAPEDPDAFMILALIKDEGEWYCGSWLSYCDAVAAPLIFRDILAIPPIYEELRLQSHREMVTAMAEGYPIHVENTLWVQCTAVDARILRFWMDTWMTEMDVIADVAGLKAQVAIQYITSNVVDRMSRNGGNSLGLAGKGPFLMFNAEPAWAEMADSPRVFAALQAVFDKTAAEARRLHLDHPYVYLNYASQYQNAFGSFDDGTREFQKHVSEKYDARGVFQKLRGAGFKLEGAPEARIGSQP